MPRLDACHPQIVRALEKDEWMVAENPYVLPVAGRRRLFIDIYAERYQDSQPTTIIVVEAKCFADMKGELDELYTTVGQYIIYRSLLRQKAITAPLYLAIPTHAYQGIFQQLAMPIVDEIRIKMMVVDIDREVIERWLE